MWMLDWSNCIEFCAALCAWCQESIHVFSRLLKIFGLEIPLVMRDAMAVPAASGAISLMHLKKWDFVGGASSTVFICYMNQHLGLLLSLHDPSSDEDGQGEPLLELLVSAHLQLSSVWESVGQGTWGC